MTDSTESKNTAPTPGKTTRDAYAELLVNNPKWRDVTNAGRRTIIGGVTPPIRRNVLRYSSADTP